MSPFTRSRGVTVARFTADEAQLIKQLATQLIELLDARSGEADEPADAFDPMLGQVGIGGGTAPPDDPALARLLPDAYRDDPEAASEHRRLTEHALINRKVANARAVIGSLDTKRVVLDDAVVQSWVRTLTDLRLAIAARLDVDLAGIHSPGADDDQRATRMVYDWLGYLQGNLVDVIE